jgi:serine/threonine protein kinase/Tfp pilus assembly protein PilF
MLAHDRPLVERNRHGRVAMLCRAGMSGSEHDTDADTLVGPPVDHATLAGAPAGLDAAPRARRGGPLELAALRELGHYVLLDKLGEGAMGVVFAAYDKTLDRKVAIKLLRDGRGHHHDEDARRRMLREAQAMARLSHPNVAQIYEVGELADDGSTRASVSGEHAVFIVMEFIDGVTLSAWRKQRKRSVPDILAVFDAAGRGLAAAHAKGLVHRDFKPDNVMIRSDARVVVMDFGLARERGDETLDSPPRERPPLPDLAELLERSGTTTNSELSVDLTATGAMLGTPAYMSPEQFRGATSDAKSDQFSFCVALWEALNGARPFAGTQLGVLAHAVTSGHRAAPAADVPGWLIAALERGLAVEPAARWPSMEALLAALARDPTRRRRAWLIAGTTLALLGGLVGAARFVDARAEARTRAACADAARAIDATWNEEVQSQLAARVADTPLADGWSHTSAWMDEYAQTWTRTSERECLASEVEHTREARQHARVVACLDDARVAAEALVETWQGAEDRVIAHAATAVAGLPNLAACEDEAWLAQRVPPPDDPTTREQVSSLRGELERASALGLLGEYGPALVRARALLREAEALGYRPLVAEALVQVGELERRTGAIDDSRRTLERAGVVATGCAHDLVALRAATQLTSVVGWELSQHEQGSYWAALGEALLARLGLQGSVQEADLRASIGDLAWARGDYPSSLAAYEAALQLYERNLGPSHPDVARQHANIGYLLMEQGSYDDALRRFDDAIRVSEAALGPTHPRIGELLGYEVQALSHRDDNAEAAKVGERALALLEHALGPDHIDVAEALNNLGIAYIHLGRREDALAAHQRALAIIETTLGPEHLSNAAPLNSIGVISADLGHYDAALASYRRAVALVIEHAGPTHKDVANGLANIAQVHALRGEHETALADYERASSIYEQALGPTHPLNLAVEFALAHEYVALGREVEARAIYERLLVGDASDGEIELGRFEYAELCERMGERARAVEQAELALSRLRALGRGESKLAQRIAAWLAEHPVP